MTIKERIKSLGAYFKEMQITNVEGQQIIYVIARFPEGWMIDDEIEDKFKVQVQEGTNRNEFYFCADIETGEEAIFDAIDYNINKMKSAIERANLLKAKIGELRELFGDENVSVEQLRTLYFSFREENTASVNEIAADTPEEKNDSFIISLKKGRGRPKNNPNTDEEKNNSDSEENKEKVNG